MLMLLSIRESAMRFQTIKPENDHMKPTIDNITWDRIWIIFHISGLSDNSEVYITDSTGSFKMPLKKNMENPHEYMLNITNPGNSCMLPVGIYKLVSSEDLTHPIQARIAGSYKISRFNKQFVYFHSERSYRVQFSDKEYLKIKTSDVRLKNLPFSKRVSSALRRTRYDLAKAVLRSIYNIQYRLYHINASTDTADPYILLMSDQSEEIGSNMKALRNALIREGYKPHFALRSVTTKHYNIFHWIHTLSKIAKADYIFFDDHSQTTDWLTIHGAVITQLWHAGAGFKSTGYSRFGLPASPAPKSGHRQYTYGIAGSKKIRHFFSEVWGINDENVLPTGMPRLDSYLNSTHREETVKKLIVTYPLIKKQFSRHKKIILFAPTYRGENKKNAYYPFDKLDMDALYKYCESTDSVMLFKMHPFVTEAVPIPDTYRDRMQDLTDYPDINDLFYVTDLLITDYSSNIYEFSLMKKPMLFYAYDIDEYSKERGFHRDYRKNVPGKIAETFEDMINALENNDFEYEKVEEYISNNFDHIDDHACDRIIDWIIRGNLPQTEVPADY